MMDSDSFTGGCLCGAVRYEAKGEPCDSLICHCRMCQRASGAPITALLFMTADHLKITKGQTRTLVFSPRCNRQICDACGSPLFITRHTRPDMRAIYVGSLDDPRGFEPNLHVCVSSAMGWLDIRDNLPRHTEKPNGYTPTLQYDPTTGEMRI